MKKETAKEIVKRNLWKRGYSVKDVSAYAAFDLVVNHKYRVFVAGTHTTLKGVNTKDFDFIAECKSEIKKYGKQIVYAGTTNDTAFITTNPKQAFK